MALNEPPADPAHGAKAQADPPAYGATARAQRRRSVAPLVWSVLGLFAVAAFVVALVLIHHAVPGAR
jgi:hypothetical protein